MLWRWVATGGSLALLTRRAIPFVVGLCLSPIVQGADDPPAPPAYWYADLSSALEAAKSQQKLLLVEERSGNDDAGLVQGDEYSPLRAAIERDANLTKAAEAGWVCASITSRRPSQESSAARGANDRDLACITWICDEQGQVLSMLLGAFEPAALARETAWCDGCRVGLRGSDEVERKQMQRDAHLARLGEEDWKSFTQLRPSRWEKRALSDPLSLEVGEILTSAATVRDDRLTERFKLGQAKPSLLARFRTRGELEGETVHLALAELPLSPLATLRPHGLPAFFQRSADAAPVEEHVAWLRAQVLQADQPIVLTVVQETAKSPLARTTARQSEQIAELLSQCKQRDVAATDLEKLSAEFDWKLEDRTLKNVAFVVMSSNGAAVSTVDLRAKPSQLVAMLKKTLTQEKKGPKEQEPKNESAE